MAKERRYLSDEEAIGLLDPDAKQIHTFRGGGMVMIGADWDREDLLAAIRSHNCEVGGDNCRNFGHGLVIHDHGYLFVETRKDVDWAAFDTPDSEPT